jgi:catechol 2,3-dioxygenase-like lactoylglutathione lyase family enzyme
VDLAGIGAITLFVADVARSRAWYQQVFDRPIVFQDDVSTVFKLDNVLVNLLRVTEADELIGPAPVAPDDVGARFQLTVWVDDADAVCAELRERGAALINGPIDRAWGQRTACFADPDGHVWEIAQTLS